MSPEEFDQAVDFAVILCRRFEGLRLRPYLCPAGVPTIGYGSTRYADGSAVQLTDPPTTKEAALELLRDTVVRIYSRGTILLCPIVDTSSRLAALIDFCYNLGTGNLRASTLRRRVNAGRWEDVPTELRKWNKGGGRVLPGLVARRESEASLI